MTALHDRLLVRSNQPLTQFHETGFHGLARGGTSVDVIAEGGLDARRRVSISKEFIVAIARVVIEGYFRRV
eukprot:CAMPEP_0172514446 /NCGR_PEP_ID=MMETSP1066-20121228/260157_1 /TAXON_ID=671091 /ORGANISM="Coscinodiscus wailesii, Strain CCMP2513" /LENGTH=70 /DNA_ID=CAMNT_0013295111 /DNA_START=93 /DNA_END=301 /DNA_ORIENTATION=-